MKPRYCAFATVLALTVSCDGPHRGVKLRTLPLESSENLVYLDSALRHQIPCEFLLSEQLESGRTRIHARFFNDANRSAGCQIKVKFKDENGEIIDETGWRPFILPRREAKDFETTSLKSGAVEFTLLMRVER